MVYLGILDLRASSIDSFAECNKMSSAVKKRIDSAGCEASARSRKGAYALLSRVYEDLKKELSLPCEMPEIFYTDEGKPYFSNNLSLQKIPNFSISHDGDIAVVAISADREVGVDAQSMPKRKINIEAIASRFFAPIRRLDAQFARGEALCDEDTREECEISVFFYTVSSDGIVPADAATYPLAEIPRSRADSEFLGKWTILEAALKMSGGGFADISGKENIIYSAVTKTVTVAVGKAKYFISVAHAK